MLQLSDADLAAVQELLGRIVGQPLSDMYRYCEYQRFSFGEPKPGLNRKGEEVIRHDYGLSVACPWQIVGPDEFMLGSSHFHPERKDDHAMEFYDLQESDPLMVDQIRVSREGGLHIHFDRGYELRVEPSLEPPSGFFDQWLFMAPDKTVFMKFDDLLWVNREAR